MRPVAADAEEVCAAPARSSYCRSSAAPFLLLHHQGRPEEDGPAGGRGSTLWPAAGSLLRDRRGKGPPDLCTASNRASRPHPIVIHGDSEAGGEGGEADCHSCWRGGEQ
jgi:hypothetical protein